MASTRTILIVMSAADTWTRTDGTAYATGYWAEELAAPHEVFADAGFAVDFASPGGVLQPLDQHSADPEVAGPDCGRYVAYAERVLAEVGTPLVLSEVDLSGYAAIVIPGGHGPVVDLFQDADLRRLLFQAEAENTVVGAVCHGPAGLLAAVRDDGTWLYAGRRMSAFTNEEEHMFGTAAAAPWLLATRLCEQGAELTAGTPYEPMTVRDGNLITGQNPASAAPMAREIVEALG